MMRDIIIIIIFIFISCIVYLKEDHSEQPWGEAEQDVVGDQEETLHHDEGLVPQEVRQEEDGQKTRQLGVGPDREQVVGHLSDTVVGSNSGHHCT